jgi:hypothetical protein
MTMANKLINPCAIFFSAIHTIAKIDEASAGARALAWPRFGQTFKSKNGISVKARASAVQKYVAEITPR